MVVDCSTKSMRSDGGYEVIKKAIGKLGLRHKEHIAQYGDGNERRLTGLHETADINAFSWVSSGHKHFYLFDWIESLRLLSTLYIGNSSICMISMYNTTI